MTEVVIGLVVSLVVSVAVAAIQYGLRTIPEDVNSSYRGARQGEFASGGSSYGSDIPIVYGRARLPANLVWQSAIREIEHVKSTSSTQSNGKDDFQVTTSEFSYTYECDFVVQVCKGIVTGVGKIWMDKQLVYANVSGEPVIEFAHGSITPYYGTASQTLPIAVPTSYRDTVVIYFENFNLSAFYNRMPVIEVEILNNGDNIVSNVASPVAASFIIEDICRRAGMATGDFYIANITAEFKGFSTPSGKLMDGLSAIVSASQAVSIYSDDKIKFIGRANDVAVQIPAGELRYADVDEDSEEPLLLIVRADESTLPSSVTVVCFDPSRDHDKSPQTSRISNPRTVNEMTVNMPLGMSADAGAQLSEIMLYTAWQERISYSFSLGPKYLFLEPGDVIQVDHDGKWLTMMISAMDYGANGVLKLSAHSYGKGALQSAKSGAGFVTVKPETRPVTDTVLKYFNAPLIADAQNKAGIWFFANGAAPAYWYHADIYYSYNAVDYIYLTRLYGRGTFGSTSGALGDAVSQLIDYTNTVDIVINHGQLTSVALADLIADPTLNLFFIGDEMIQAANVVLIATNTYRLSTLLRGRFGTEHYTASHAADDKVGYYPSATFVELNASNDYNVPLFVKAVSNNQLIDDVSTVYSVISDFRTLLPYSPVNVDAQQSGGDIVIAWRRRSRYGSELPTTGAEVPLYETSERYEVEILDGSDVVKRVLASTVESVTYTAAQQTADFGGAVTTIRCRVYQLSDAIGRGTPSNKLVKTL